MTPQTSKLDYFCLLNHQVLWKNSFPWEQSLGSCSYQDWPYAPVPPVSHPLKKKSLSIFINQTENVFAPEHIFKIKINMLLCCSITWTAPSPHPPFLGLFCCAVLAQNIFLLSSPVPPLKIFSVSQMLSTHPFLPHLQEGAGNADRDIIT